MLTIHKYPFPIEDRFTLDLPRDAKVLAAECQGRTPCLWAEVDPDEPAERVDFALIGTGHPSSGGAL